MGAQGQRFGKATVEDGFTLDINLLIRNEDIEPGQSCFGTLSLTRAAGGQDLGSISYEANLTAPDQAWISLHYRVSGESQDCRIRLESMPVHFGGRRWWFRCPATGRRCAKLHLPIGQRIFASRMAHDLGYQSHRVQTYDRALDRAQDIRMRLGGSPSLTEPFPERPKNMWWRTFWRLKESAHAAECVYWRGMAQRFS